MASPANRAWGESELVEGRAAPRPPESGRRRPWRGLLRFHTEYGVLVALAAFSALFGILAPHFLSLSVWGNITVTAAFAGIPAIGVVMLMISGEFDLSVGATFQLAPMFVVYSMTQWSWGLELAIAAGLLLVLVAGLMNAAVTCWLGLPSFIGTLGMAMFLEGIEFVATGGSPVSLAETDAVTSALGGSIGNTAFYTPVIWFLAIGVAAACVLSLTRFGNWIFASGGNAEAARAVGVPVARVKTTAFVTSALLSGVAGVMQLAYLQQWQPTASGNLALAAIVIAVLGGTSLFGGVGSVVGSMIGAVLVGSLSIGLVLIGAPGSWYTSLIGAVLIVAVVINKNVRSAVGRLGREGAPA